MKRNLYIFRHGQTDYNVQRRMQGVLDIPLNETGIAQAHALAEKLKDVHLDCIYTSKLSRAKQTAEIVAQKNNTKVIVDNGLHEWNLGIYCGKILNLIKAPKWTPIEIKGDNVYIPRLVLADADYVPQGGESFSMFRKRICDSLEDILKNTDAENIGIATHGGAIRAILSEYTNYANGGMPNAEYFVMQWDGKKLQLLEKPAWLVKKHPVMFVIDAFRKIFHTR